MWYATVIDKYFLPLFCNWFRSRCIIYDIIKNTWRESFSTRNIKKQKCFFGNSKHNFLSRHLVNKLWQKALQFKDLKRVAQTKYSNHSLAATLFHMHISICINMPTRRGRLRRKLYISCWSIRYTEITIKMHLQSLKEHQLFSYTQIMNEICGWFFIEFSALKSIICINFERKFAKNFDYENIPLSFDWYIICIKKGRRVI